MIECVFDLDLDLFIDDMVSFGPIGVGHVALDSNKLLWTNNIWTRGTWT